MVRDHFLDEEVENYKDSGYVGPNYRHFERDIDVDLDKYPHHFAAVFETMWPGSSKRQLVKMNGKVREINELRIAKVKEFTLAEWWHGIGIIIIAGPTEYGGVENLYK